MRLSLLIYLVHASVGVIPAAVQDCKYLIDSSLQLSEKEREDCREVLVQEIGDMNRRIQEETETLYQEIAYRQRHLEGLRFAARMFQAVSETVLEGHGQCNDERVSHFYKLSRRELHDEWIRFAERRTIPTSAETAAWSVEIVTRISRQAETTRNHNDNAFRAEFIKGFKLALGPIIARIDDPDPAEHPQITSRKFVIREMTRELFFADEYLSQL